MNTIESPGWHGEILKERMNKTQNCTAVFLPIDELKASRKE